jgi:hypothetical protein
VAKYFQTFTPVPLNLTKWIRLTPVRGTDKLRVVIVIPPFSVDTPLWLGASYITLEFRANFRENFSIILPVRKPTPVPNFILAVRSVRDYVSKFSYFVDRKKFWNITEVPGELPSWDLYTGSTICKSFALEIWSVESNLATSLTAPMTLETSILIPVAECCDLTREELPITEVCNLFAPLPLELTPP